MTASDKPLARMLHRLLLALSAALLLSCGPSTEQVSQERVALPAWLEQPSAPGYVGVVSSAMPQPVGGLEGQRRAALLMARAELGRMQSVQASSVTQTSVTASGSKVRVSSEDFRRVGSVQALSLSEVTVREEWLHPVTGELFLWLVYPVR